MDGRDRIIAGHFPRKVMMGRRAFWILRPHATTASCLLGIFQKSNPVVASNKANEIGSICFDSRRGVSKLYSRPFTRGSELSVAEKMSRPSLEIAKIPWPTAVTLVSRGE